MKLNDLIGKLETATRTLMVHPGTLPERVQAAHNDLIYVVNEQALGPESRWIGEHLSSVKEGNFSRVTDRQYREIAGWTLDLLINLNRAEKKEKHRQPDIDGNPV